MEPLTPLDPPRIGPYRLLGRLGEGAMGRVYLARTSVGRMVVVKTIFNFLAQEPGFRRRFEREVSAARLVGGQWTAPVLDADSEADTPWVATDYLVGLSLRDVVDRGYGPLPERSVRLLANGLAHALRDIHGVGLVHRDLKPSNVLLTIEGPRVIDFGIARALEPGTRLTLTGTSLDTPVLMSPEQVRGERPTPASDIFSLGMLLAFAATGRTPFGPLDGGIHSWMFRIVGEMPDLTGIPESLHQLISGCLAKDPAQRFSLDHLLSLTVPDSSDEPWLPGPLIALLGRTAIELLAFDGPVGAPAALMPPWAAFPSPPPAPMAPMSALSSFALGFPWLGGHRFSSSWTARLSRRVVGCVVAGVGLMMAVLVLPPAGWWWPAFLVTVWVALTWWGANSARRRTAVTALAPALGGEEAASRGPRRGQAFLTGLTDVATFAAPAVRPSRRSVEELLHIAYNRLGPPPGFAPGQSAQNDAEGSPPSGGHSDRGGAR